MKTMARQIGTVLCMALALLSAFYAFAVMKTHSGTGFWKVWLVIAAVFALLAVGIAANWWVALPRIIRGVIIAVVCIGIAIFGTVEGCIISNMHARGDQHLDYVVVLGAQVRKSGPSKALRYRLDTAADYLRNSPDTICIVGHTPTIFLTGQMDVDSSIWHGNRIIDIDCGCGNLNAPHRRLACLRLDDMAEFYVGRTETENFI